MERLNQNSSIYNAAKMYYSAYDVERHSNKNFSYKNTSEWFKQRDCKQLLTFNDELDMENGDKGIFVPIKVDEKGRLNGAYLRKIPSGEVLMTQTMYSRDKNNPQVIFDTRYAPGLTKEEQAYVENIKNNYDAELHSLLQKSPTKDWVNAPKGKTKDWSAAPKPKQNDQGEEARKFLEKGVTLEQLTRFDVQYGASGKKTAQNPSSSKVR